MLPSPRLTLLLSVLLSITVNKAISQTVDMAGPPGSRAYGFYVTMLTNGNYVITDPYYSEGGIDSIGAVYLYNGSTNALISTLKGSTANDLIGQFIVPLSNGNFVVTSPWWSNGSSTNAGEVTWVNGTTGLDGRVSSSNSLVGTKANDFVSSGGVFVLANGNCVVASPAWSNGADANTGAATFVNVLTGLTGTISSANSLIGGPHMNVGRVRQLANGNYVAITVHFSDGNYDNVTSLTWCNGTTGRNGILTADNSFILPLKFYRSGIDVYSLANGNYLIYTGESISWGNGSTGLTGTPNSTNTWQPELAGDTVTDAILLPNGNYLITGTINGINSVTWANGSTGAIFHRTSGNSFLSGSNITTLGNGSYVLSNQFWNGNRGAVTLCKADGSTTGTFNSQNSMMGGNVNDYIGSAGIVPLLNNNYVVCSPDWNGNAGAVTLCQSDGSTTGVISGANSITGTNPNDSVGCGTDLFQGAVALSNGNYVISSPKWNHYKGGVTWASGVTGITGQIDATNSLVGSSAGDKLGIGGINATSYYPGVFALGNGNYVVASVGWNGSAGAVTWGNGTTGSVGTVNSKNSLTGIKNTYNLSVPNRSLASVVPTFTPTFTINPTKYYAGALLYTSYTSTSYGYLKTPENIYLQNLSSNYIIQGIDGNTQKATITWGNGNTGITGSANSCNTVYGAASNGFNDLRYTFDSIYNFLLVARSAENIVSRYYPALGASIPATNDNSSSTISGNSQFIFPASSGCGQIAALRPSGVNPVSGSVSAKTWLESPQPANFVARHFEITPSTNAGTATGTITLYFSQTDFDGFNNQSPAPASKLPTGPTDAAGIANVLVQKESGVSGVGTGLPGTYPGPVTTIDPDDNNIVWNTTLNRWEVSFDVTGFSGFFIKTKLSTALPLQLLNFSGQRQGSRNSLQWKTVSEINTKNFVLESSTTGNSFIYVGTVAATGGGVYTFIDNYPPANRTYYRLKMIDVDGKFTYSNIIWINGTGGSSITLYPNPVTNSTTLNIGNNNILIGTQAQLTDASGRLLQLFSINNSQEQLSLANLPAGLYFLKLKDGNELKIFKQ